MSDFKYYRPSAFPPVVKYLIIINVLMFVAQLILPAQLHFTEKIMLYPIQDPRFHLYQIITHMFAHSPQMFTHILFNMFGLWMFGRELENVWGGKRFLNFYLICGIGAAICHLLVQYYISAEAGPALGASGAVMGIFAGFGYLFPNTPLYIMLIPIPVKAKWAVLGLMAIDLFGGIAGRDNVAHFAHLGGAITGFILVLLWNKRNRNQFY